MIPKSAAEGTAYILSLKNLPRAQLEEDLIAIEEHADDIGAGNLHTTRLIARLIRQELARRSA